MLNHRSINEEYFNAYSHLLAAFISAFLILFTNYSSKLFLTASFFTFLCSYLYHIEKHIVLKKELRKLDIASIFCMVPASVYDMLPTSLGNGLLFCGALMAAAVVMSRLNDFHTDFSLITFSIISCLVYANFADSLLNLSLGVLLYSGGLLFYFMGQKSWTHAGWHACVLCGWGVHVYGKQ
jgi:predicted membrane channel-forming protein YqfA (hemolysin III family)